MRAMIVTAVIVMPLLASCIHVIGKAVAHQSASGMVYDIGCCSNRDCAPAEVTWLPDGRIEAKTIHGTAVFDLNQQIRPSTDGQWHACIVPSSNKGRCLYGPAGI